MFTNCQSLWRSQNHFHHLPGPEFNLKFAGLCLAFPALEQCAIWMTPLHTFELRSEGGLGGSQVIRIFSARMRYRWSLPLLLVWRPSVRHLQLLHTIPCPEPPQKFEYSGLRQRAPFCVPSLLQSYNRKRAGAKSALSNLAVVGAPSPLILKLNRDQYYY